ncbi:hypothetical protein DYB32_007638 [Aphanomyces invadans]|uniref:HTH CENPB-type domain-containing protein n=1 Tax=Aphanomyces invadans TaxID=157072 RepID=A0A418AN19_9STRA|nr:hypothetical protein DYB32_007638 [Aphanomyces invadans]
MMSIVHDLNQPYQLSSGWYERFLCRHSELKTVKSQVLSKARNSVDVDTVVDFYHELVHSMSLVGFEPSRVYNMDETSFSPNKVSRKVVVHRNSAKVYVEEASASAHVTIVACVCADGTKVPPLFVLPGSRVTTEVCDNLSIPGEAVTTSEKGWTSSYLCRKWLSMLNSAIPASTPRPILLVLDGCSSHYSNYIFEAAMSMGFLLQFLPANSTHVFQQLDVAVFRPFKQAIRREIADDSWGDISTNISKHKAIAIACRVWMTPEETSISNGFVRTGLYPTDDLLC